MANDDFSEPLGALTPKIPFSGFADFWVWVTSGFFLMVASNSEGFWVVFVRSSRPLDGCNYHREGPQIYPKFAPRAHRGRSALIRWSHPTGGLIRDLLRVGSYVLEAYEMGKEANFWGPLLEITSSCQQHGHTAYNMSAVYTRCAQCLQPEHVQIEHGVGEYVCEGAFSQSPRTAPIITVFIPGTPPQTTPLQKRA